MLRRHSDNDAVAEWISISLAMDRRWCMFLRCRVSQKSRFSVSSKKIDSRICSAPPVMPTFRKILRSPRLKCRSRTCNEAELTDAQLPAQDLYNTCKTLSASTRTTSAQVHESVPTVPKALLTEQTLRHDRPLSDTLDKYTCACLSLTKTWLSKSKFQCTTHTTCLKGDNEDLIHERNHRQRNENT